MSEEVKRGPGRPKLKPEEVKDNVEEISSKSENPKHFQKLWCCLYRTSNMAQRITIEARSYEWALAIGQLWCGRKNYKFISVKPFVDVDESILEEESIGAGAA